MTPFSIKLRRLRESRGLWQKALADKIGVGATYLSALERGRKLPPQGEDFFLKLQVALALTAQELEELRDMAVATETLGPLAQGTSPLQMEIALRFASRLKRLEPTHLMAIKAILDMVQPSTRDLHIEGVF